MVGPPPPATHRDLLASSQVVEVASGLDALYLSGRAVLAPALLERLEGARAAAVETDGRVPFAVGEEEFGLLPRSFGKYRFSLDHPAGLVGVTASEKLPTLRVQVRAEFLHAVGPRAALIFFEQACCALVGGPVRWSLSRLDLFCDVQGWALCGDDRHRFLCRGQRRDTHEESEAFTGFEFGRRSTKTVCARIYDKTIQVERKGLDWWYSVWDDRFDPDRSVLRVEFEIGRQGLVEFGVRTPNEGLEAAPRLWASVSDAWLSYRMPTADQTKARWPVSPEWAQVQQATLREQAIGVDRVRAGVRQGELRRLTPQLVGYLTSVGAVLDLDDLSSTLGAVRRLVSVDEGKRGVTFPQRVATRQAERAGR